MDSTPSYEITIKNRSFYWFHFQYHIVSGEPGHYNNQNPKPTWYDVFASKEPERNLFIVKDSNKFKPLLLMCYNNPDWWQFEAIPHCKYVFESETVADEWIAEFEAAANIFATLRPEAAGAVVGCLLGGAKG